MKKLCKKTLAVLMMFALLTLIPSAAMTVHADEGDQQDYPFSAIKLAGGTELTDITFTEGGFDYYGDLYDVYTVKVPAGTETVSVFYDEPCPGHGTYASDSGSYLASGMDAGLTEHVITVEKDGNGISDFYLMQLWENEWNTPMYAFTFVVEEDNPSTYTFEAPKTGTVDNTLVKYDVPGDHLVAEACLDADGAAVTASCVVTDPFTGSSTIYIAGPGGVSKKDSADSTFTLMQGDFNLSGSYGMANRGPLAIGGTDSEHMLMLVSVTYRTQGGPTSHAVLMFWMTHYAFFSQI